jgi:chromosomal replication initiator protein
VPLGQVVAITAEAFSLSVEDMTSISRRAPLVRARQVGMFVARELGFSLQQTTLAFGRQDHTTAVHALDRVKASPSMLSEAGRLLDYVRGEMVA